MSAGPRSLFTYVVCRAITWPTSGVFLGVGSNFAIPATAVARRVQRLPDGLSVGSPVNGADLGLTEGYSLGWGLVFHVSPDLFKVAKRGLGGMGL